VTVPLDGDGLEAGQFSTWLGGMRAALGGEAGSDVPCGSCTACCTSSQFVHIGSDETDTLGSIPPDLRFPAPGLPIGHVVLGYDDLGHCPMLVDRRCSIYPQRPRACRTYDCRVFAAAGVDLDDERKEAVAGQVRRWRFSFPTETDRDDFETVRAAAATATGNPTQRALLAIEAVATRPTA
jgi:uncharacterized protein